MISNSKQKQMKSRGKGNWKKNQSLLETGEKAEKNLKMV